MAGLTVGHALDPGTRIGPVADASQLAANLGQIKKCWSKGEVLVGCGKLSKRPTTGHYLSPALFTEAANLAGCRARRNRRAHRLRDPGRRL